MTRLTILAVALLFALATPASAQHVIYNPGWCAQFYPNANCQNYGPGNPYTSYGWRGTYGYWVPVVGLGQGEEPAAPVRAGSRKHSHDRQKAFDP
jgi:hypothetical protein